MAPQECRPFDQGYPVWTALLQAHNQAGQVRYGAWLREDRARLEGFLGEIQAVCRTDFDTWSEPERLAFWINAYNAYTIELILDERPRESIRDIGLPLLGPWDRKFIPLSQLGLGTISLNHIEHEVIRKAFSEPRIHFAVVCASTSCPVLRADPYLASRLEEQLDAQARVFLADVSKNRFDTALGVMQLSKIFSWYGEDFVGSGQTLPQALAPWLPESARSLASRPDVRIEYLDYDWSLNGSW